MPGPQFAPEDFAEAKKTLSEWLIDGKIKDSHTFVEGFEKAPDAIMGLFSGLNKGKMLVRVPQLSKARL